MNLKLISTILISFILISGCVDKNNLNINNTTDSNINNTIINTVIEDEYYDCPPDLKAGGLSAEGYRKMGVKPPQCKKDILKPIPTPTPKPTLIPTPTLTSETMITNNIDTDIKNRINDISESSIVDSTLKSAGIREYTHEELINKIKIINPGIDGGRIQGELQKTDDNILKYIKSITVHNSNSVSCSNSWGEAIGCAPQYYINNNLDYGTIDIVYSNFWLSSPNGGYYCSSFEYTLNHEIGHIYGGSIDQETGSSEWFANDYATKHTTAYQRC